jgi:ElaB/YqjD/DUF883 family membrane-anchored ribosome-binding protein
MAETNQTPKTKTARKSSAKAAGSGKASSKPAAASAGGNGAATSSEAPALTASNTAEAKGRFNAALQEAKAGAAALRSEAADRASAYRNQARTQSEDWVAEARAYGDQAKSKAGELATDGKGRLAEALSALGRAVFDTAPTVDEKLGAKYGDYARSASRSLQDASTRLDTKTIEELGEDARELVRKSPGLAVGLAAVGGFLLARLFRGSND